MNEVAVAFPDDETTAGVIVGRLHVEGIDARIDRGMFAGWLAPGQLRVMVDERDAKKARAIVDAAATKGRR